jgi:transposase
MFVRVKPNKSGSTSVQVISKANGKYIVVSTIGSSKDSQEIAVLKIQAQSKIKELEAQQSLFVLEEDAKIESFLSTLTNGQVRTIGPELVFGKVFDSIGYNKIPDELFRHLVLSRIVFPLSKLKTIEYLYRFRGISLSIDTVYRYLDKISVGHKEAIEKISFNHTKKLLNNQISIVFYDMTTLYFEASDEDDLRKTGFSKDGKHSNPQIYLGLLVGLGGYAIGYDIFEGDIYEAHTLIPTIQKISKKFDLNKPIIVADAGLLSNDNIKDLEQEGYEYILGARIKNESKIVKQKILSVDFVNEQYIEIAKGTTTLIVQYLENRAKKDKHNRTKGLERIKKAVKSGKLTKSNINNRGYNKYLKMEGKIEISVDEDKFEEDNKWDGLKGYVTNCKLTAKEIIANYKNLWHIEKAFRMSKTDLRVRPIYHRLKHRIEAHICISFVAYSIYKELERVLSKEKYPLSVEKAAEITQNIYEIEVVLPESLKKRKVVLGMDELQTKLIEIINKNY